MKKRVKVLLNNHPFADNFFSLTDQAVKENALAKVAVDLCGLKLKSGKTEKIVVIIILKNFK